MYTGDEMYGDDVTSGSFEGYSDDDSSDEDDYFYCDCDCGCENDVYDDGELCEDCFMSCGD